MDFRSYLKSKKKFFLIWFLFHGFALFVNIFSLSYNWEKIDYNESNRQNTIYRYSLFTDTDLNENSSSHFYPFVSFYEGPKAYFTQEEEKRYRDYADGFTLITPSLYYRFHGILYQYDVSEFIFYSILIIVFFYFRFESIKNKRVAKKINER